MTDPDRVDYVRDAIIAEIERLKVETVDEGVLADTKSHMRYGFAMGLDNPGDVAATLAGEDVDPEYAELSSFLKDVASGSRPKADIDVGLQDSVAVMLANLAMDEQRKVAFAEIEQMGREGVELSSASSPNQGD